MAVSSTWLLSLKLLLISTGLVSISVLIKIFVPSVTQFICYEIPIFWSCLMSLLKPPYLYFVINGIIIIIAVLSRYHGKTEETGKSEPLVGESDRHAWTYEEVVVGSPEEVVKSVAVSTWAPPQKSKLYERLPEKPPKTSPQGGRPLRSAKPKNNESLESTRKTTTEGRRTPLVKKCNTWDDLENQDRPASPTLPVGSSVKKPTTFRDRTNYEPAVKSSLSPRKEPSLSQDEFNRRVEAFIRKFNDEMRLQRQDSLNQYMDMIERAK